MKRHAASSATPRTLHQASFITLRQTTAKRHPSEGLLHDTAALQNSTFTLLFSMIAHGSENCLNRYSRDHVAYARFAGEESMAGFLAEWVADHPEQVVENGAH